jgi:EpsI family protein
MMSALLNVRLIAIGLAMLAAAGLAVAMKPTERMADQGAKVDLEVMIPKEFGDWRLDPTRVPVIASPDVQANLDKLYNQILARTYLNSRGERIMLSIAYGGDQGGDATQVHRPEFCYAAQGFALLSSAAGQLTTQYGMLPVRRLRAIMGARDEPITYWVTVGDKATLPGFGRKLLQLRYGLTGRVPDGMLVRVSSIGADTERQYQLQTSFVNQLLSAVDPSDRVRLTGVFNS